MSSPISSKLAEDPAAPPINTWVLALIDFGNRHSRSRCTLIVAGLVLFIGWIDYITGTVVSLGLFYLVPIILSALWFGWRVGCFTSVASTIIRVGGDIVYGGDRTTPAGVLWNRLVLLVLYVVLVGLLDALNSLQRQLEQRVKQRTAALARALEARDDLQRQLVETASRERNSVGRELHDGLGQHLMATSLAAKMLSGKLEATGNPIAADAQTIVRMTQDGIAQTRQLARGLLLAAIEPDRLLEELEELCANLQKESGVVCRFAHSGYSGGLDGERSSHVFYIAQEAARNALRHARASRIQINLTRLPGTLELSIRDDGAGLPAIDAGSKGMGLRIMAHRSELIGGRFSLAPACGSGVLVTCSLSFPSQGPL